MAHVNSTPGGGSTPLGMGIPSSVDCIICDPLLTQKRPTFGRDIITKRLLYKPSVHCLCAYEDCSNPVEYVLEGDRYQLYCTDNHSCTVQSSAASIIINALSEEPTLVPTGLCSKCSCYCAHTQLFGSNLRFTGPPHNLSLIVGDNVTMPLSHSSTVYKCLVWSADTWSLTRLKHTTCTTCVESATGISNTHNTIDNIFYLDVPKCVQCGLSSGDNICKMCDAATTIPYDEKDYVDVNYSTETVETPHFEPSRVSNTPLMLYFNTNV